MRRLTALALAVGGGLYLSRRRRSETPRVDVYYDDGSTVTLDRAAPGVGVLVATARRAL